MPRLTVLAIAVVLAAPAGGCGQQGELTPKSASKSASKSSGAAPVPYGRDHVLSADALLAPTPQAAPERSVELHTRSEPRRDDPFNLPPATK